MIEERFELIKERIGNVDKQAEVPADYSVYFGEVFGFVKKVLETYEFVENGQLYEKTLEQLRVLNRELYEDIFPGKYENSFFNPEYSVKCFGKEMGQFLSFLAAEMRALIGFAFERDLEAMVIRMELLLEIYTSFVTAKEENVPASINDGVEVSNLCPLRHSLCGIRMALQFGKDCFPITAQRADAGHAGDNDSLAHPCNPPSTSMTLRVM